MLEAFMGVSLVLMGIYFFKSTDLPKDMKDRSAQMNSENFVVQPKKMAFPQTANVNTNKVVIDNSKAEKLAQLEKHKRELDMKQRAQKIDELTMKITALEQELKTNNARNAEIMAEIEMHMNTLKELMDQKLS